MRAGDDGDDAREWRRRQGRWRRREGVEAEVRMGATEPAIPAAGRGFGDGKGLGVWVNLAAGEPSGAWGVGGGVRVLAVVHE